MALAPAKLAIARLILRARLLFLTSRAFLRNQVFSFEKLVHFVRQSVRYSLKSCQFLIKAVLAAHKIYSVLILADFNSSRLIRYATR